LSVYDFYQRNFLDDDAEKNVEQNEKDNGQPVDREMGGRIIQCLRTKYIDTSVTLTAQCVTELMLFKHQNLMLNLI
jgi:hypothetical protein